MKISTVALTSAIALGVAVGLTALPSAPSLAMDPHKVEGKISKVEREGRVLHINGKKYAVSGSRTNVCIKGACDEDRGKLKAGMSCSGNTSAKKKGMELKKISCK